MFAGISGKYDLLNRLLSGGRDQGWRRRAVRMAELKGGERVLDCCCGTGDLTLLFRRAKPAPALVAGSDFTPEMLHLAAQKAGRRGLEDVPFVAADALKLPFEDAGFDVVSVAFGVRNLQDISAGLREFARVLRPGGRLVVLEFTPARSGAWRAVTGFYMNRVVPGIGQLISRSRDRAYRYLPDSIEVFPDARSFAGMIEEAGFRDVHFRRMNLGTVAIHAGCKKPAP